MVFQTMKWNSFQTHLTEDQGLQVEDIWTNHLQHVLQKSPEDDH
jgi:hypothetical protein